MHYHEEHKYIPFSIEIYGIAISKELLEGSPKLTKICTYTIVVMDHPTLELPS